MSIYKTAIQKPITTGLVFVAVMVLGLFALSRLPIDQFPEMDPPYISVMTTYPGANASEIETNVSKILENSLNSVDGLKYLYSTSKDNISVVTLELEWGTNLDEVMNDVRTYVDFVYDNLPDGVSRPMILKMSSSQMPIMQLGFTAEESYAGLEKILDDNVVNVLNRVDGIGNISLTGAPDRYIYIDLDPNQLDAYNLSVETVGSAISGNNLNLASGTVKMGKEQYQLRVESEYKESEEINNIVVTTTADGKQVFVRDLATVRDTIKDLSLDERISILEDGQEILGREGARIQITKQTGANTVQICEEINEEMAKIMKTLPPDIKCTVIRDGSIEIKNAIYGLAESIFYALLFVVLVVLVFLGDWRSTVIISLTIPISLIVSFLYLMLTDSSLNIVSLASLTVAIGMVVDDAIVVLENITKHIERGSNPREAAIYATNEVWISVIATTLVIVAVFVPLTMLTGMAGVMFKELGWIVTLVVCTSTATAITLIPMLCSKILKARKFFVNKDEEAAYLEKQRKRIFSHKNTLGRLFDWVDLWYSKLLRTCLNHKLITMLIAFGVFGLSLIPFTNGSIGTDFMQQQDNGSLSIKIELQRGTRIEETLKTARQIECRIHELVPETKVISTSAGSNDESSVSALFASTTNNKINMTVRTSKKYERERTIFEIAEVIREELKTYPEIINYSVSTSSQGGMSSNNVSLEVYGYDFDQTNILATELKHKIQDLPSARDVTISREEDRAELQINFDKEKLARHGLSTSTAAAYVRYRVNGMTAGYLKEDGEEYDIVVRLKEEFRNSITDIEELTIMSPRGEKIKLKELADINEYWCPPNIERKNRQRYLTISVTPYNASLGELANDIQGVVDKTTIPLGITTRMGGSYEKQQETFGDMITLALLIMMLVYIVMASQFESFSKPFIIMMSIPFAITGTIVALLITGATLDMMGALGLILLIGIVVKNGIVLVDYINLMRDRGYELNEAIALSGQSRIRPVLMTAFTTILGMVPMAMSTSEGSEMWQGMGIVVIGGLTVSTFITLVVVPVLYGIFCRKNEKDDQKKIRKQFVFMDINNDDYDEDGNRIDSANTNVQPKNIE